MMTTINLLKNTIALLVILLVSCQPEPIDLGIAADYLPSQDLLRQGIVNKYYEHGTIEQSSDTSTTLYYRLYQLKGNKLHISNYEHADKKTSDQVYRIENNRNILELSLSYPTLNDTIYYEISDSISIDWSSSKADNTITGEYNDVKFSRAYQQIENVDTTITELPAKSFAHNYAYTRILNADTTIYNYKNKVLHIQGLGISYSESIAEDGSRKFWSELVEQFTLDDFLKQSDPSITQVGYIDTLETLDKDTKIELCETNNHIYDYYYGQQPLHYENGKRGQWKTVNENIESEKLFLESGYLTFRFVVNCQGEASRFVTEQEDLDFRRKEFNKITVDHFFKITNKLKDWIPRIVQGDPVDAYFYITYKLKKGKLEEILP